MKLVAALTVNGNPVSKARARVHNGGAHTPAPVVAAEERIQWAFLQECQVEINDTARYRVMLAFVASDRRRRDIDNLAKLVLDALNGYVWKDDWQIDELSVRRYFVDDHELARTVIEIYDIGEP